jgi:hypothetical protein
LCTHDTAKMASIRALNVAAMTTRDAGKIASDLLSRLEPEQIEEITFDAQEVGDPIEEPRIEDVWQIRSDDLGHRWTREKIESDNFTELVKKIADETQSLRDGEDGFEERKKERKL